MYANIFAELTLIENGSAMLVYISESVRESIHLNDENMREDNILPF